MRVRRRRPTKEETSWSHNISFYTWKNHLPSRHPQLLPYSAKRRESRHATLLTSALSSTTDFPNSCLLSFLGIIPRALSYLGGAFYSSTRNPILGSLWENATRPIGSAGGDDCVGGGELNGRHKGGRMDKDKDNVSRMFLQDKLVEIFISQQLTSHIPYFTSSWQG